MSHAAWELVFMMFVLKLPIVYLCVVIYWAVKAQPKPLEGALRTAPLEPPPTPGRRRWRRPPRGFRSGPHGTPVRGYARHAAVRTRAR